ncbi:MAG TPA: TetR/AcrR family transcriptional regulator [Jatrophihabitantaceae bacterium]|jgi:AcrR family transcriptional regulator
MTASPPGARQRILDIADELFYRDGIHTIGVDAIVTKAGTAKTTLYSHFRSKDELVATYLQRRSDQWVTYVETALDERGGSARDRIMRVFDLLAEWIAEPGYRGCPFINACAELAADHPAAKVARAHRARMSAIMRRLVKESGARRPDALTAQLMMLYDAAMVASHIDGNPAATRTARAAVKVLLDAAGAA